MRISLLHFAAIGFVVSSTIGLSAQAPQQEARLHAPQPSQAAQTSQTAAPRAAQHTPREAADNPVADPRAVVVIGNARFTVLTPELIRMEWAADGKFEDHASFVFINRRLPVPKFLEQVSARAARIESAVAANDQNAELHSHTMQSTLRQSDGRFTADSLSITLTVDGKAGDLASRAGTTARICRAQHAPSTARAAIKDTRTDRAGSRIALRLGTGRRLYAAAV